MFWKTRISESISYLEDSHVLLHLAPGVRPRKMSMSSHFVELATGLVACMRVVVEAFLASLIECRTGHGMSCSIVWRLAG